MIVIRALFFLNSFAGGGAERVCLNLAEQLYKSGIVSDFIIIFNTEPDYDIPDYIQVFSLGLNDPFLSRFSIIKQIPKVNSFISGKEYVLVTAHLDTAQYLASLTKVRDKTLYVMHVIHQFANKYHFQTGKIKSRKIWSNRRIVTVSKGLEKMYCEYGIESRNIRTIYNPCVIRKSGYSEDVSPHVKSFILVMGRLEEEKNPLLALELFYKGGFYDKFDLIYLGKGSLENDLREQISYYKLDNYVFIVGFQKFPEHWLKNASLLLSCSKKESFAMNLVEALICGTPVVATDCPYGPKEILIDELSEYLIYPEKDFNKSISVISSALESYPQITKKYYERFDAESIVQMYLKVWKEYFGVERIVL